MPSPTQRRGGLAEDQAVLFLQKRGYVILDRHVTSRYGEIDILAQDGATIVAVEVRARRTNRFGTAAESVTSRKLGRITLALQTVLQKAGSPDVPTRIDLVSIDGASMTLLKGIESTE